MNSELEPAIAEYRRQLLKNIAGEFKKTTEECNAVHYGFVKHLTTLAAAMLSLAVAFVGNLRGASHHPWLLQSALAFLAITILSGLAAHYGQVRLLTEHQKALGTELQRLQCERIPKPATFSSEQPLWAHMAFDFQILSFSAAILGLCCYGATNV